MRTLRFHEHGPALAVGLAAVLAVSMLSPPAGASATGGGVVVNGAAAACAALSGTRIPAHDIGLPTRGAVVDSAGLDAADPAKGTPEFCLVTGHVIGVDPAAPPVNFEVNLPTDWNLRTLHLGGGGLDGTVVTGLAAFGTAIAPGQVPAIDLGYVTFGSDGGSSVGTNPPGSFALNATALANYSGEAVKRTRDTAITIVRRYYGRSPNHQYFAGGSKGGQEALAAAERYGEDYDGIVAYFPADQQTMDLSWYHLQQVAYGAPGAYLDPAKQQLFEQALLGTCDGLDGVVDGVISDVSTCRKSFRFTKLRCPGGADTGDACLSDLQIATLEAGEAAYRVAFPLANGVRTVGGFPILAGGALSPYWLDSAGQGTSTLYNGLDQPVNNYFYRQLTTPPPALDLSFDYRRYQARIQSVSAEYDTTDPDLDRFAGHGGKLIMVQGDADMLVPPAATDAFYDKVAERYGAKTKQFTRYYKVPGYGHGSGVFNLAWDSVAALDSWVTKGDAPEHPVAYNGTTPGQTRPLCQYPGWPKYRGHGDAGVASGFRCVTS
ncbi:tannase/feruloyl esterase family alpha/beta hydrolase [Amycolatopsis pigmentata]|uniref:Tannase/feruloyl esterase family alpha/beta hydrolase n=1 Tax=Amycolatopsis pigmentata TaxID=450801 RepID=A0ABW5G6J6_9PSEU